MGQTLARGPSQLLRDLFAAALPARFLKPRRGLEAPSNSGTSRYDKRLIPGLRHDHRDLMDRYRSIGELIASGRCIEIPAFLAAFCTHLDAHLLTEDMRLHGSLEQAFANDPEMRALVQCSRDKAGSLARAITRFARRYRRTTFDESRRLLFASDYIRIGGLLSKHIQHEEARLYTLYCEP
jgi:hypothetical protein